MTIKRIYFLIVLITIALNLQSQQIIKTWLWKIEKRGIKYTSYLFGTFHEAGNSVFDSFQIAKKFLTTSKVLLVENDDTTLQILITQKDVNKGYGIWMSLLNKDQHDIFLKYITKYNLAGYLALPGSEIALNLHYDYISQFCSRYLKDTLFMMDYQIQLIAQKNNIIIKPLDKIIGYDQIHLNNLSQVKADTFTINEIISIMSDILNSNKDQMPCKILDDYINVKESYSFDIDAANGAFSLNSRNRRWFKIIKNEIKNNSCFIAVGFNHLKFKNGLIKKLQKEGFKLSPIQMQ